ncbi:MAG TPA: single-stranded-DNA-specific exonuclease RecJ [Anaerolineales bacterium]|nr:single-stranded-DNA-specific exonuclease RecJ [Anaerolineales bacterium]
MTRWLDPQSVEIPASFSTLNLPSLVAQTLLQRGIRDADAAVAFLHPNTLPPVPFPGIKRALDIILLATRKGEPICVWGDFDVDGQTSTTLLVQTLRAIGANVVYYIPIRGKESHGLHIESLKSIIDNGAKLIVTCDTGITANEAVDYANSRGVDVVITDHHDLGESLPNAKAIVNPKLLPNDHPLSSLAGVGVAYKLAETLFEGQTIDFELLDLVALGLIADVALIKGETRSLAQKGIQALRETKRIGLKVMAELAGANLETLTEETIGFTFAPRLNALGRLSDANSAVELLLTQDNARARVLAAQIEGLNAQRRLLTSQVYEAAQAQLQENPSLMAGAVIILSHRDWPGGVVGIVANKLAERYHKPAIILNESEDGVLRGSARSIEGLNISDAITTQKNLLLNFGGHPMAAGLSLQADKLTDFHKGIGKAIEKQLGEDVLQEATLQIDPWLGLDQLNLDLAESLESLAPFGAGNPELTLGTRSVRLRSAKEIGRTKDHRRLVVEDENGVVQDLLWWNGADEEPPDTESKIDIAYSIRAGTYRGEKQLTVQFHEFRIVEQRPVEIQKPKLQIKDWRVESRKLESLKVGTLVWAEGSDKEKGMSRYDLHPADELAIYTIPPSPAELRAVLEIVAPKTIYLFAVAPTTEKTDEFLARLAGMAKFAINQRGGKVSPQELATSTAQREATIRIGLEWLGAGGHIKIQNDADEVRLSEGDGQSNPYLQRELYIAVKGSLEETAAYRTHFAKAEAESLFEF